LIKTGRVLFFVFVALLSKSAAFAFDSTAWDVKRNLHRNEALRLRAAYSNCVARLQQPADDVTIPVDQYEDGSVKSIIYAKRAQFFLDTGLVWGEGVVVRKYDRDGALDSRIDASSCVVDRYSKSGWAEGDAKVVHGKTTFTGRGVYFSSPESYVKVFEGSDIVSEDLKFGGARP